MSENPVLSAMEVYRRTHPHRSDELDEAFERYDPDSGSAAIQHLPTDTADPEQTTLELPEEQP